MTPKKTSTTIRKRAVKNLAQPETEVRILLNQAGGEQGTSGLKEQSGFVYEAYNPALFYPAAYATYNKIRRSTPEIVTIRQAFTTWCRSVYPTVDLPEDPSDDDKKYRDFLLSDFSNMEGGFDQFIETTVNHVPFFGFGWWDVAPSRRDPDWIPPAYTDQNGQTWKDDWRSEEDDGYIGIRKIGWRATNTFSGWVFDGRKEVIGMKQVDYPNPPITLLKDHSLHMTFGDPNSPEGVTPLEAVWRLERIKYNLEIIMGIGYEHSAGHFIAKKTQKGTLSEADKANVRAAARAILTAQEGNYALLPFGIEGQVADIPFQSGAGLLDAVKYYGILMYTIYMMQFVALNTQTNTGALASQVDSTQMGLLAFNSMLDGFAQQYDDQIGKRLWKWNKDSFPGATKRPKIKFSHVENAIALNDLASFFSALQGKMPLGNEDYEALRNRSGWMPKHNPAPEDIIDPITGETKADQPAPVVPPVDPNMMDGDNSVDQMAKQASEAKSVINQALRIYSRNSRK